MKQLIVLTQSLLLDKVVQSIIPTTTSIVALGQTNEIIAANTQMTAGSAF